MPDVDIKPYGSWKSPITSALIVGESVSLSQPAIDEDEIYWLEMRPSEGGRNVIVRRDSAGVITEAIPRSFNARTRVHEYGGGDYVVHKGLICFSNFTDQRLYKQLPGQSPQPITPEVDLRYAEGLVDEARNRLVCVREDHTVAGREAVNTIAALNLDGAMDGEQVLVSGNDFYSTPRLSPDGSRLAWLTWNHPNMPWDESELWVGEFAA
ncbi:MAG TPA: hypothetical protein VFH31_15490, partial [Pyrinomonadaceae bacterium]|nr:hypothetical protein [Pyrinomonadaceae bacterium]